MEDNMTEKENFLRAVQGKDHPWVPEMRSATEGFFPEWMMATDPATNRNYLGIEYTANENGRISSHANPVLSHVSEWKDKVKFPDPSSFDWKGDAAKFAAAADPGKAHIAMSIDGLFLTLINLMGWVEGLCTIAEEPEIVGEFYDAASDFYAKCVKLMVEHVKPDIIGLGDDMANEKGPFISRSCFRSLYRPYYRKIIKVAEDAGIPVDFHCCGTDDFLLDEFVDMGVRIVQIPRPYDDVKAWKKRVGTGAVLEGGWDWHSAGGLPNASEAEVRASARETLDTWARNDPAFIFWEGDAIGEGQDMKNKVVWIRDEVAKYGKTIYS
jgi:uroporphyrinogen-III decarboxylase